MLILRIIAERFIMRPLLRFRLAWFFCAALGLYLTLVIVLFTLGQRQVTLGGGMASCQAQRDPESGGVIYTMTMRQQPAVFLTLDPVGYSPALPADVCWLRVVSVVYTQTSLGAPYAITRVEIAARRAGQPVVYANATGRDFTAARNNALWLRGGGMALLSILLLIVGVWWERIRLALGVRRGERLADDLPTALPDIVREQIAEGVGWLSTLPWGKAVGSANAAAGGDVAARLATASLPDEQQGERLAQGLALIYGWGNDEARLMEGVNAVIGLPPALAYTGASAAALQLAKYAPLAWAAAGARMALAYAARALSEDAALPDARIAYVQALAALGIGGDTERATQAEQAYQTLTRMAPTHPRLAATRALVALARHDYATANDALCEALAHVESPAEARTLQTQRAWVTRYLTVPMRIQQVSRSLRRRA